MSAFAGVSAVICELSMGVLAPSILALSWPFCVAGTNTGAVSGALRIAAANCKAVLLRLDLLNLTYSVQQEKGF